jgi:hypothetical protein
MSQAHRQPPLPVRQGVPRGTCRWCGKPVNEGRRYYWHKACFDEYEEILIELSPQNLILLERQGWKCAICGEDLYCMKRCPRGWAWCGKYSRPSWYVQIFTWQDDHVIPLADALPHADDPLWAWRLSNRQAVCKACHIAKTVQENQIRATWRRRFQANQMSLPLEAL